MKSEHYYRQLDQDFERMAKPLTILRCRECGFTHTKLGACPNCGSVKAEVLK